MMRHSAGLVHSRFPPIRQEAAMCCAESYQIALCSRSSKDACRVLKTHRLTVTRYASTHAANRISAVLRPLPARRLGPGSFIDALRLSLRRA